MNFSQVADCGEFVGRGWNAGGDAMNLYKRGNIWWLEYVVDGKRHRESTGATRRADAKAWLDKINVAKKMPTFESAVDVLRVLFAKPKEGVVTIDGAWTKYITVAEAIGRLNAKERTLYERRKHFDSFVTWLKGNAAQIRTVAKVDGPVATKFAEHLASSGKSTATRANIIGDLSVMWGVLCKAEDGIVNPWTKLAPTKVVHERILDFTDEQAERVLAAAKEVGRDWYPMCVIARRTGLRYGDIATLRWKDVDMEKRCIHKTPSKTERYDIRLTLPMVDEVYEVISAVPKTGDFLFPLHAHYYGKRGKSVQRIIAFSQVLAKAGIEGNYSFHSWRHTAASNLAAAGVSKETRKMILGHTTDQNSERYDHSGHLREIREALEAAAVTSSSGSSAR